MIAAEQTPEAREQNRLLTRGICSACHSFLLVQQQRLDKEGWAKVIRDMTTKHGLILPGPEIKLAILNFLSEVYSPDSPERYMDGMPLRHPNPLPGIFLENSDKPRK